MKYEVVKFFTDLQDNDHPYYVGDVFPRDGITVTETRLQELSTAANRQGVPLIQAAENYFDKKRLSAMRVSDLSSLAQNIGLDTSGCKVKADFVTLLAATTTASAEQ